MIEDLKKLTTNLLAQKSDGKIEEDKIEGGKLTWTPWIGDTYKKQNRKMLVVGESHYYHIKSKNNESFSQHLNPSFTQFIVEAIGIERRQKDKRSASMYDNFYRTFRIDNQSREGFWNSVAFYNLIQQPMFDRKERPSMSMIKKAWTSFNNVLEITDPDIVIFIGVKSCDYFPKKSGDIFNIITPIHQDKTNKISDRQIPRITQIEFNEKVIPFYFISHCSAHYSWSKWRAYFQDKHVIP